MKTALITSLALMTSCSEKSEPKVKSVRIDQWHDWQRPVSEYRERQPDRPILVFYTADWGLTGKVAEQYIQQPRFMDLMTEHKVLPLIANCTDRDSKASKYFEDKHPVNTFIYCFQLSRPGQDDEWFMLGEVDKDKLYELLSSKLSA